MVLRSFFAIDNANMVVTSSSSGTIVGNGIINNSDTPNGTEFLYSAGGGTTITLDDTGGSSNTFDDDDESNHVITDGGGIVGNGTEVESESHIVIRALDGSGNPTGPEITIYVFSEGGVTSDVWGFSSSEPLVPGTTYRKISGNNTGSSLYNDYVTCFVRGTMIETADGPVMVEGLKAGDLIKTADHDLQPIRWAGQRKIGAQELEQNDKLRPIRITAGALGNGLPATDLLVSRQHRMLTNSPIAERMFGATGVLVSAIKLTALPGIFVDETVEETEYFHLLFDRHEIIFANDSPSESLFTGPVALKSMSPESRKEILTLFPELAHKDYTAVSAKPIPAGGQQKQLVARHRQSNKPIL
ncbi:MAG: Hint domain-containing protein [Paracoccaceae bacterium]